MRPRWRSLPSNWAALGFQRRFVPPAPELPWLEVTNPQATALSERILAQGGWHW